MIAGTAGVPPANAPKALSPLLRSVRFSFSRLRAVAVGRPRSTNHLSQVTAHKKPFNDAPQQNQLLTFLYCSLSLRLQAQETKHPLSRRELITAARETMSACTLLRSHHPRILLVARSTNAGSFLLLTRIWWFGWTNPRRPKVAYSSQSSRDPVLLSTAVASLRDYLRHSPAG